MNETYLELTKTYYQALTESQTAEDELKNLRKAFEDEISDLSKYLE